MQKGRASEWIARPFVVITRLLLTAPIKDSRLGGNHRRVLRFEIDEETKSSGAHHSQLELNVDARSGGQGRRQCDRVGREAGIETAAIGLRRRLFQR